MRTEIRLRRRFAEVLAAVLAVGCGGGTAGVPGTNGTSSGGSSSSSGSSGTSPDWASACSGSSDSRQLLAGLSASPAIDGAAYRSESAFPIGQNGGSPGGVPDGPVDEVGDSWKGETGQVTGTLCATHSDPSACKAKIAGLRILPVTRAECAGAYPASFYNQVACQASYIVYTRGDEIGVARNVEETKALINGVNTLAEAVWAATQNGKLQLACESYQTREGVPASLYRNPPEGGYDLQLVEAENCGETTFAVTVHVDLAGNVTETSRVDLKIKPSCAVAGRRPEGYRGASPRALAEASGSAIGEYFASMATLEAAAVIAFRRLYRELVAHGAPRALLARVRKAIKDEIRHARSTTALALAHGVTPAAPAVGCAEEARSLLEIARENAREGCVRETYGAIVAQHQVLRAANADVRACMSAIADEETEHAALSWDIAAWIEAQLDDVQRAELAQVRRDAITELASELEGGVGADVSRATGVPMSRDALALLDGLAPMMLAA
ncbi:MAG: hypothetical protein JST00_33375 [Deltaproteobacteria bacterium]|nr:hypothetical protein [Deltaproteobacteria bacterium]